MGNMSNTISSFVSRRGFLSTSAGAGAVAMAPTWLRAVGEAVAPMYARVAEVLAKTIGIDMHNHVYPAGTEPHPQHGGGPQQDQQAQGPEYSLAGEIRATGLTAVCASYVMDFAQNDKPGDAMGNYLGWLTAMDAQGQMRRALTLKDLEEAHAQGRPTIVQTVEGAQFIEGRLEGVEEVYRHGLRHLQLLHMKDDMVKPLGDVTTAPAHLGGLTTFGAEVVKECNRLGILVDLAHASAETVKGALTVATKPVLVSHTSLDSFTGGNQRMWEMMQAHLISKEHAKVVADTGGVVGVWTHMADTLAKFVESIKAMVDAIGIDHVGIGTDTDLLSARDGGGTNTAYPAMRGGFFPAVVGEMLRQGFAVEEIAKVGGGTIAGSLGRLRRGMGELSKESDKRNGKPDIRLPISFAIRGLLRLG